MPLKCPICGYHVEKLYKDLYWCPICHLYFKYSHLKHKLIPEHGLATPPEEIVDKLPEPLQELVVSEEEYPTHSRRLPAPRQPPSAEDLFDYWLREVAGISRFEYDHYDELTKQRIRKAFVQWAEAQGYVV